MFQNAPITNQSGLSMVWKGTPSQMDYHYAAAGIGAAEATGSPTDAAASAAAVADDATDYAYVDAAAGSDAG